jgi:hypothetical protein
VEGEGNLCCDSSLNLCTGGSLIGTLTLLSLTLCFDLKSFYRVQTVGQGVLFMFVKMDGSYNLKLLHPKFFINKFFRDIEMHQGPKSIVWLVELPERVRRVYQIK